MRKFFLSFFITLISLSFLVVPSGKVDAVAQSVIGPGIEAAIQAAADAAASVPAVPTTDTVQAAKEVKLCFFRICIPGMDKIAIMVTKAFIERLVDSTVDWINNGFDGNPAYVTDPKQYFTDIADGVAGQFIEGSDLAFLCSPFQVQVKLALKNSVTPAKPFQCTLTDVVGNVEDFYGDFSQGGWDGWFAMTQNNTNNPYGGYLEAKIELDSRIAEAVGLENKQLEWGKGFLSFQPCVVHEDIFTVPPGGGPPKREKGKCLLKGPIETPGTAIESGLEHVMGTGIRQLELADEFDELIGALVARALQDTILGAQGLFKAKRVSQEPPATPIIPPIPGGETGPPTEWVWNDRGGPAYQSSKCSGINPRDYFFSLIGDANIVTWQQTLDSVQQGLWDCGIGEQRTSGGEARGRLFLPTAACPDAAPDAADAILGVRQNPACWTHEVDVVGFTPITNRTEPPITP